MTGHGGRASRTNGHGKGPATQATLGRAADRIGIEVAGMEGALVTTVGRGREALTDESGTGKEKISTGDADEGGVGRLGWRTY